LSIDFSQAEHLGFLWRHPKEKTLWYYQAWRQGDVEKLHSLGGGYAFGVNELMNQ